MGFNEASAAWRSAYGQKIRNRGRNGKLHCSR